MGSLMTSESQDTHLTSHPKDSTLHREVSSITALGHCYIFFLDQRKECLVLALQHPFQQHLVSHPGTDQDQPCLASEASQQWYAGWYAAGQIAVYRCSPSNLTELERICRLEWEKHPIYRCAKLVASSYPRRLKGVIAAKGASTKY